MKTQACTKCQTSKPITAFHRSSIKQSGRTTICKECRQRLVTDRRKGCNRKSKALEWAEQITAHITLEN